MVRCLIVDDEPNAHLVLKHYIEKTSFLSIQYQCYTVQDAIDVLNVKSFDLIFLDLNLPDASGFSLFHSQFDLKVILTTAYSEYAVQSYEYAVLDYLLKPFSFDRFQKAIMKADFYKEINATNTIMLKVDDHLISFNTADIIYIQSWGNYVKLFTITDTFICYITTSKIHHQLNSNKFVRIHKSYIVNRDYVDSQDNDFVILKNQTYLPVGITYRRILDQMVKS